MTNKQLHHHNQPTANARAGMTLLEIIIVVALLGTLGVYLITNLTQQADTAKIDQTKLAIGNIRQALQLYRVHLKKFPTTDAGLQVLLEILAINAGAAPTSITLTNYSTRGTQNLNTNQTDAISK